MLIGMVFDIKMDRELLAGDYISPGSYTIKKPDGREISFDFEYYEGGRLTENVMYCEVRGLDLVSFPAAAEIVPEDLNSFTDFFIYTGEDDEPEIKPVKLLALTAEFSDNDEVSYVNLNREALNRINKIFNKIFKEI